MDKTRVEFKNEKRSKSPFECQPGEWNIFHIRGLVTFEKILINYEDEYLSTVVAFNIPESFTDNISAKIRKIFFAGMIDKSLLKIGKDLENKIEIDVVCDELDEVVKTICYIVICPDKTFAKYDEDISSMVPDSYEVVAIREGVDWITDISELVCADKEITKEAMSNKIKRSKNKFKIVVRPIKAIHKVLVADNVNVYYSKFLTKILKECELDASIEDYFYTEYSKSQETVKIIGTDNYDRDNVSDILIADNVSQDYINIFQKAFDSEKYSELDTYIKIVPNDHKLYEADY